MKVVENLNKNKLLRDKQYGFRSSRSTADVLIIIIAHRINESFDDKNILQVIVLDIKT